MLFGGYRRGDANDPDMYVAAVAAVLSSYDVEIIRRVTDPRTGISTHEKFRTFMPNSGELKAYCDEQQAVRDRIKHYAALPKPTFVQLPAPPRAPGSRANLLVRHDLPGYQEMLELTAGAAAEEWKHDEEGRGIWVPLDWYEKWRGVGRSKLRRLNAADILAAATQRAPTDDELAAMYRKPAEATE